MERAKKLVTGALLTFVVFTCGYAVGKEVGVRRVLSRMPGVGASPMEPVDCEAEAADHVVVWYFHGTKRCAKCNAIESLSQETLDQRFADQVESGTVRWRTANMDDAWNADAVRRYGLVRSSLVLVDHRDGAERDHTVLNRVWDFTDRPGLFHEYVASEVEFVLESWAADEDDDEEESP